MNKVTMKDIANLAGVSKATVSMVLNNKNISVSESTRNKILKIAEELNYIPNGVARSLSTKKSQTIGIILPDIINPFFSEIARAIEDTANKLDYNVIFCNTDSNSKKEEKYIKLLISKLVDGVIFITGGGENKSLEILKSNNVPFVLVDRDIDNKEKYCGVYCLNEEGVKEAVEYLLKKKKKKIVFVTGKKELRISKQRVKGYKSIMVKNNIYDEKLIFEGDFTIEGGMKVTEEIIQANKDVEAIFYSNDIMAFGGIKVLIRKGYRIPEDISIIGFDNINISNFIEPELTTVAQPIYDMGKQSCEALIEIIDGKPSNKQIYFKPKLMIRGTA
ncbi:LacI family DNA-binding transcriptional regulator [Clostridium ganghwense]|uniref:LacI family DNA-binding transcriptional regulator n=1 Tax=Clostridium ganghwense TaxID=312089 RepID=A0ABT4CIZ9_9CLOT|nr:LacI family DNA-binding transcriptional regulator [Clostridium ganghwense]MCY6369030.1 LacI family DNA-binding transcriptional regulator [Clostridium ganghwense]